MAENEPPPPNSTNAAIVMAEGHPIARTGNHLANLNGNHSRGFSPKPAKVKKIDLIIWSNATFFETTSSVEAPFNSIF
jgi:hypothetical protein